MRIAVDLVKERGKRHLRAWELSTTLGLIDRYLEEAEVSGTRLDPEELAELIELAKKELAPKALQALRELQKNTKTHEEAVMLAARVATIAMRRPAAAKQAFLAPLAIFGKQWSTTWLLRKREIGKLNRFVLDSVKRDERLGIRAPPQWYARLGDFIHGTDQALALEIYAKGRKTWRYLTRPSDPLWIHALGLVQADSAEERQIASDLAAIKEARTSEFANFMRRITRSKSTYSLWLEGREKITSL